MNSDKIKGTRGKFFWKEKWISICSMHRIYEEDCNICNAGYWTNVWKLKVGNLIYDTTPNIWRWWMNRPGSKARKQIMELFPKLKNKENES